MKANISPRDFGDIFYAAVIRRVGTDVWLPLASVPEPLQLAICNEIRDTDTDSGEWEYFGERYEFLSESPSPVAPRPGCRTADQWAQSIVDSAEARIVGTKEWLSLSDCPSWVRDTVVQEIMDSASKSAAADPFDGFSAESGRIEVDGQEWEYLV